MAAGSAEIRAARRRLQGLRVFLHVVYALLFFEMLRYLPQAEDMAWAESRLGLIQLLIDNRVELLRIVIGGGLALIYWNMATTQPRCSTARAGATRCSSCSSSRSSACSSTSRSPTPCWLAILPHPRSSA